MSNATHAPQQPRLSTPERLERLEKNQAELENTLLSAIRDLAMNVNQMHRTTLSHLQQAIHSDHHHVAAKPTIMFTFIEAMSLNSMYRVYLDAADHPICPNKFNIHTRAEGSEPNGLFDDVPVDPTLCTLIEEAFARDVGSVTNKVYFVEVHSLSDAPIDESSVVIDGPSE